MKNMVILNGNLLLDNSEPKRLDKIGCLGDSQNFIKLNDTHSVYVEIEQSYFFRVALKQIVLMIRNNLLFTLV